MYKIQIYLALVAVVVPLAAATVIDLRQGKQLPDIHYENGRSLLFSKHLPFDLPALKLTPGELKQIAGHSFQLLKAKCPAVSEKQLNSLNKYIGKLISRANPQQGSSPVVSGIVSDLTKCEQNKVTSKETPESGKTFWTTYFAPIRSVFYKNEDGKNTDDKIVIDPSAKDKKADYTVTYPAQTGYVVPQVHTIIYTNSDDDSSSVSIWRPFQWFGNVFDSLKDFIETIFGSEPEKSEKAEKPEKSESAALRKKRDIEFVPDEESKGQIKKEDKLDQAITKLTSNTLNGRDGFLQLFDNVCRVYCSKCGGKPMNFKSAIKELLEFIIKDVSGSNLAAQHFMDTAFLQALNNC